MQIPVIQGIIDRRMLVNFRVRPDILARVLPAPFRPKLVCGWGIAGICLIRLKDIRPRRLPAWLGFSSENAAHRIAVEWDAAGTTREGVYVPRRDSNSCLNRLAGGRLFPGEQHYARFDVEESGDRFAVRLRSDDGAVNLDVDGRVARELPSGSVFGTLAEASAFFERGSVGYSATSTPGAYDGMELCSQNWQIEALEMTRVASSFFADAARFPAGSAEFDCALLMRGIRHEWHAREPICVSCVA